MINPETDKDALALEYVLGTLRGAEREDFAKQLDNDEALLKTVRYWEESLMPSPDTVTPLAPNPSTFKNIQTAINPSPAQAIHHPQRIWEKLLPWKIITSAAFAMLLLVSAVLFNNTLQPTGLTTDYVAVLVDDSDTPILTALTTSDSHTLWVKWEQWQTPKEHSLQLWAKSRRDGQIRPLLVFGDKKSNEIALNEATLRLIQDASHLMITQEEVGGSPLDEPSEIVIAKGVCIRLAETRDSA